MPSIPRWYVALMAGSHACVSSKCSGRRSAGRLVALHPEQEQRHDHRAGQRGDDGQTLHRCGEAARDELQQYRRTRRDDDQQREPGDVVHRAMNTHTTTSTTANTVKIDA